MRIGTEALRHKVTKAQRRNIKRGKRKLCVVSAGEIIPASALSKKILKIFFPSTI